MIYVFTHDSLAVGEDGPTHQPVEQLAALRAIPNFTVIRPADANETAAAWKVAIEADGPVALILTRQNLPVLPKTCGGAADQLARGAYVMAGGSGQPDVVLIATGSEAALALEARKILEESHGVNATVVSMPSWELFQRQPDEYKEATLPRNVGARLSIEAAASMGWCVWTGCRGDNVSVDCFGASAPGGDVMARYGFNVANIVQRALDVLKKDAADKTP